MFVIKRNGNYEQVSFDKIHDRIMYLTNTPYKLTNINTTQLTQKIIQNIYDKISTTDIDNYTANLSASLSIENYEYGILAGRISINNCHKNTMSSFMEKMAKLYNRVDSSGSLCPLLNTEFYKFIKDNYELIESRIDYSRDYSFDFFGFKTLEKSYLMKIDDIIVERPQDLYMRVAIYIHFQSDKQDSEKHLKQCFDNIFETYDLLSLQYFTHATPTLFNAGSIRPSLASCFLLGSEDSLYGIMKTATDCSNISKWAGGIGFHISNWRGSGSLIRTTNGKSNGTIPFLRIFNDISRAFNQGGKRLGSFAAYIEPHHPDIMMFLNLKRNHGDENLRTRDLFTALWISDLFMQRVKDDAEWSTFDPDICPGLSECYGNKYKELYENYERSGKSRLTFRARDIWSAIFQSQKESGLPYMLYKDTVNTYNNQKNIGVIKGSNLCCEITIHSDSKEYGVCLTGDTLILTENGYERLDNCDGKQVLTVFNNDTDLIYGESYVKAKLIDNGLKDVYELNCSKVGSIKATKDHLFLTVENVKKNGLEIKTWKKLKDLKLYDRIYLPHNDALHAYKNNESNKHDIEYLTLGCICSDSCYIFNDNKYNFNINLETIDTQIQNETLNCITKIYNNGMYLEKFGHILYENIENLLIDNLTKLKPDKIASILSGLFCNGSAIYYEGEYNKPNKCSIIFSTNIPNIIYLIQRLLKCFGIHSNVIKTDFNNKHEKRNDYDLSTESNLVCTNLCFCIKCMTKLKQLSRLKSYNYNLIIESFDSLINFNKYIGYPLNSIKLDMLNKCVEMIKPSNNKEWVTIKSIKPIGIHHVYDLNVPVAHHFVANCIVVHNCVLGSICLSKFVNDTYSKEEMGLDLNSRRSLNHEFPQNPTIDYKELARISGIMCRNLDTIIDKNLYPCAEAEYSTLKGRPIGIGVQGLADVYYKLKIPFDSTNAKLINKNIFESIYYGAISMSTKLAKLKYQKIKLESDKLESDTKSGSYPAYNTDGGSPLYNGQFTWQMYGLKNKDLSGIFDWNTVANHVKIYGVRNSLLTALMPTASTAQINGNIECFEPITSNMYKRRVLSGEFIVFNKYLIKDLIDMGIWDRNMINYMKMNGGSIQNIEGISDEFKKIYRTSWEIPQKSIMDMAVDRQPFVDQSQSMNLFFQNYTFEKFNSSQFYAWEHKLKTGSYYIRTNSSVSPQKFTVCPTDAINLEKFRVTTQTEPQSKSSNEESRCYKSYNYNANNYSSYDSSDEICLLCSS